jgi:hypothetical protein
MRPNRRNASSTCASQALRLQGQMRLCIKVVAAMRQWPATPRASSSTTSARPGAVLLKFTMSEDRQAALQGRKGLAGTKLGLDEDLTPTQ